MAACSSSRTLFSLVTSASLTLRAVSTSRASASTFPTALFLNPELDNVGFSSISQTRLEADEEALLAVSAVGVSFSSFSLTSSLGGGTTSANLGDKAGSLSLALNAAGEGGRDLLPGLNRRGEMGGGEAGGVGV